MNPNMVNEHELHLLQSNVCYTFFGEDSEIVPFNRALQALDEATQGHLFDIASRLSLVNQLTDPALKLYLLCTCIDSLANPDWVKFVSWLSTRKPKLNIAERNAEYERLFIGGATITTSKELSQAVSGLHEIYLEHHGITRTFGRFFMNLPEAVKVFLVDNYLIVPKDKSFLDPDWRQFWFSQTIDKRLESVAKYLFKYRRNKYTHDAKEYQTTWPPQKYFDLERARGNPVGSHSGATQLTFYKPHDPDFEIELTVLAGKDETLMLQTVIICHCRGVLGVPNESVFIERHFARHINSMVLRKAIAEIEKNKQVLNYYSAERLAYEQGDDRYYGMPRFKEEWLEKVLHQTLQDFRMEDFVRNEIKACIRTLKAMNEHINALDEQYPPLYIRNKREDLKNVPEDFAGKTEAKVQLFRELNRMYEFHSAGRYLVEVEGYLTQILNTVPIAY